MLCVRKVCLLPNYLLPFIPFIEMTNGFQVKARTYFYYAFALYTYS